MIQELTPIRLLLREAGFKTGIYAIQHRESGKAYVGSSKDIPKRVGEHFTRLRNGTHHSEALQNYWNKYSEQDFIVLLLEKCEERLLLEVEQIFIDSMGTLNGSPFAVTGKTPLTITSRKKISDALRGVSKQSKGKTYREIYGTDKPACGFKKGEKLGAEVYAKLSASTAAAWASGKMKGTPKSPETRAKMAEARRIYWERKHNVNSTALP